MLRGETIQSVAMPAPVLKRNSFQHMDEPRLEMAVQTTLAGMFLRALSDLDHMTLEHGLEYIAQRGCFGPLAEGASVMLYPDSADKLTAFLHSGKPARPNILQGRGYCTQRTIPCRWSSAKCRSRRAANAARCACWFAMRQTVCRTILQGGVWTGRAIPQHQINWTARHRDP